MTASHATGETSPPLRAETIYDNLAATANRHPDSEALVSCHQGLRYSYGEFLAAVDEVARGLMALGTQPSDRVGIWSPNRAEWVLVQYATAAIGAILVNINPAYRTDELEYALRQSGVSLLVSARTHARSDYEALYTEVAERVPTRRVVWLDDAERGGGDWDELLERAGTVSADRLRERAALLDADDPDQHPVHQRHHRLPEGRHAHPPQHLEQRILRRRALSLLPRRPRLHPRALLPLLRHGAGQPGLHNARRLHGHPGRGLRRNRRAGGLRVGALHQPLRRAHDVHRLVGGTRTSPPTTSRTCAPASWRAPPVPSR